MKTFPPFTIPDEDLSQYLISIKQLGTLADKLNNKLCLAPILTEFIQQDIDHEWLSEMFMLVCTLIILGLYKLT